MLFLVLFPQTGLSQVRQIAGIAESQRKSSSTKIHKALGWLG
jgi:hypothetical protein